MGTDGGGCRRALSGVKKKMKVLYIASGDAKYGASKAIMPVIKRLKDENKIIPMVVTRRHNELNAFCDEHGIENYSCYYCDIMAGAPYQSKIMRAIKHIVKYLLFLTGSFTRHFIEPDIDWKSIDLIHINHNRIDIGYYWAKKYKIPCICHIREFGQEDYNVVYYKRNCIEYMNRECQHFIAISEAVKDSWVKKGIRSDSIEVIYDGVESTQYSYEKGEKVKGEIIRIVMVGHIQPNKGQHILIDAIGKLPAETRKQVHVDFIGEAYEEYMKELRRSIKRYGIEAQVSFLGYVSNVNERLKTYDIGINASKSEGFGLITVEYMMAGLIVIASDTGANLELVQDGVTGLVYRYGDAGELADRIRQAVQLCVRGNDMGIKACRDAVEKFDANIVTDKVFSYYMKMIRR